VSAVEQVLQRLTGQVWKVRVEMASGNPDPSVSSAPGAEDTETSLARARRDKEAALQAPLLKRAVDLLGAQVVQMEDGFKGEPPPSGSRPAPGDEES
jgi:hypothetical protein